MELGESHARVKEWMEASTGVDGSYRRAAWKFIVHVYFPIILTWWALPFGSAHSTSIRLPFNFQNFQNFNLPLPVGGQYYVA